MRNFRLSVEIISIISLVIATLGIVVNCFYTFITYLLWQTARKTIQLNSEMINQNAKTLDSLSKQINHQINVSLTSADHKISDSHRELFLNIILNPKLLSIFAKNSGVAESVIQRNYLATFLINHCSIIYSYKKSEIISLNFLESFAKDSQNLFSLPFIKERWSQVSDFHTADFQNFVTKYLLKEDQIDIFELLKDFEGCSYSAIK